MTSEIKDEGSSADADTRTGAAETVADDRTGERLRRAGIVLLSVAEVQSGHDRQRWAEGLILQLPETHDGRNSWLINYGTGVEAAAMRERWNRQAVEDRRSPSCTFNGLTLSTGSPALQGAA